MLGNKKDLLFRTNQNINGKSIEIRKYSERTEFINKEHPSFNTVNPE